jgi:hypothetical protein
MFAILAFVLAVCALAQPPVPPDPFAGVVERTAPVAEAAPRSWVKRLFSENFGFRREVMSQFSSGFDGEASSRQSVGFEVLKKFSSGTSTFASFNFQGRMVGRDGFIPVQNDMEGQHRAGWSFEYHNVYLDFYNLGGKVGRVNLRAGRFYVPFGLNLQTDTHGPVMQLSNDRNFGFERDWYSGLWGSLNRHLNYDAYYMVGSGYDLVYRGQKGMGAGRISLANRYSSRFGLEGGASVMAGERLGMMGAHVVNTRRYGGDGRWRRAVPTGSVTVTGEFSGGRDGRADVFMQLEQVEYLRASRRWGVAGQYRRFRAGTAVDEAVIGEFSWYFRNDVGNSNLHWMKAYVAYSRARTVLTVQYYFYR